MTFLERFKRYMFKPEWDTLYDTPRIDNALLKCQLFIAALGIAVLLLGLLFTSCIRPLTQRELAVKKLDGMSKVDPHKLYP